MAATSEARVIGRSTRPSASALVIEGFREIWSRRRLARYLVRADLVKTGADTLLGNIWWILDPLLQMVVYVVLVQVILGVKTPDYPLFVFAAILPWKWFTSSTNDAITSVTSREKIIKQVKFPKIVLPFAATVGGIVNFAFGLIPLAGLLILFYSDRISPYLVLIPVIAVVQFAFTLAFAVFLAAANVFFRDLGNLARHLLRLWFYLSPALYSADRYAAIKDKSQILGAILKLNPWTVLFEAYHDVIFYKLPPDFLGLAVLFVVSLGPARSSPRSSSSGSSRRSRRSCERTTCPAGSSCPRSPAHPMAIEVADLGVRYSLRFTKKTTVRTSFQNMLQRREGPEPLLGPPTRELPGAARRMPRGDRPERRRQEHPPPGPGRDPHPERGADRRPRPDLEPPHPRRRVRPRPVGPRQHPAGRRLPRDRPQGDDASDSTGSSTSPTSASSSRPRSRPTRPGCGPASGSRSRPRSTRTCCCWTRSCRPATRSSGRSPTSGSSA